MKKVRNKSPSVREKIRFVLGDHQSYLGEVNPWAGNLRVSISAYMVHGLTRSIDVDKLQTKAIREIYVVISGRPPHWERHQSHYYGKPEYQAHIWNGKARPSVSAVAGDLEHLVFNVNIYVSNAKSYHTAAATYQLSLKIELHAFYMIGEINIL